MRTHRAAGQRQRHNGVDALQINGLRAQRRAKRVTQECLRMRCVSAYRCAWRPRKRAAQGHSMHAAFAGALRASRARASRISACGESATWGWSALSTSSTRRLSSLTPLCCACSSSCACGHAGATRQQRGAARGAAAGTEARLSPAAALRCADAAQDARGRAVVIKPAAVARWSCVQALRRGAAAHPLAR